MLQVTPHMRIFLAVDPVDFRRGIDGLAQICRERFKQDPFNGHVFVFHNKRRTSIKLLYYDGYGFWLCLKRLSRGKFKKWVCRDHKEIAIIAAHELQVLLMNGDYRRLNIPQPFRALSQQP